MAAPSAWIIYNDFLKQIGSKLIDLAGDTIKMCLVASTSNAINAALVGATYGSITNEVANGNGYTTGGVTLTGQTWVGGGATPTGTFDTGNGSWTGATAGFSARAAVVYDSTTGDLIAYCLLDSTPADVTWAAGNTIEVDIANLFVLSKA